MVSNIIIGFFFLIGLCLELYYLRTGNKRDFLLSICSIMAGAIIFLISNLNSSILPFFTLAIVTSLIGDLFMAEKLQFTGERIIDGIMGFTVAHICYIYAFYQLTHVKFQFWYVLPTILVLSSIYFILIFNPDVKPVIKYGSIFYMGIIVLLFITILRFATTENVSIGAVITSILGICLFAFSDTILAYNEFKKKLPNAEMIISLTYVTAQILLQLTPVLL